MKPVIGITVDCAHDEKDERTRGTLTLNWNYAEAVAEAGGVPLIIPPMADMAQVSELIDGWLIPGGDDIDASHFGEENHPSVELQDPSRYLGEKSLYESLPKEMPIFGICYGCQFMNVVRGGSLFQHIPDVPGSTVHTGGVLQNYEVYAGTKLADTLDSTLTSGKSYHHQAVNRVGEKLQVTARSEDGTVEALEAGDRPWMIGVQWHPERTLSDDKSRKLFSEFVKAAARYRATKHSG